jgi:hypothetical protein
VGFPIRKSSDQSAFAAPRGLSQRTTSFIASQRQGIHRMPLRHLIAPMIHARIPREEHAHGPRTGPSRARRATGAVSCPCEPEDPHGQIKTRDDRRGTEAPPDRHLCRTRPGDRRCRRRWCPRRVHPLHDVKHRRRSGHEDHEQRRTLLSDEDTVASTPKWWSQTGSNRRPHACKARALPTELWPRSRIRHNPRGAIGAPKMVGLGRLERPTSPLSGVRSNHLSYRPEWHGPPPGRAKARRRGSG